LAALLLPALATGKSSALRVKCASNQRQLGLAAQLYFDDNDGRTFSYLSHATNGGRVYWFGWLQDGSEGERAFDPSQGALYPYLMGRGVEICPGLNYGNSRFKLKATGAAYGYGVNIHLTSTNGRPPVNIMAVRDPSGTALLADAAQINDFQAPASAENPLLEEWYYIDADTTGLGGGYPNVHFRHRGRADVLYVDSHVEAEHPERGSLDTRLPGELVGRLSNTKLLP
jgi:prepilin-type processing-associated H-X9-DG protein